jgi:hypothetical protein
LIPGDQEHEQMALEDNTRFISFKAAAGALPVGESSFLHAEWE